MKLVSQTVLLEATKATFHELYGDNPVPLAAAKLLRKLAKFNRYLNECVYLVDQASSHTQYDSQIEEVPSSLLPSL